MGSPREEQPPASESRYFFVDEAGDLSLFDKRGRSLYGVPGASRCFMVGFAEIPEPDRIGERLEQLRVQLLQDPYFAGVPSMRPETRRTAIAFHAKDDPAEVRREVFRSLPEFDARVFVAIRRKERLTQDFRAHFGRTGAKRGADSVYDQLVTLIFENRLHQANRNRILFARRGKSDRNAALTSAIELSKLKFERKWRKGIDRPTTISSAYPSESPGLQVVDYYLWALQRKVEQGEGRFFELLRQQFKLIIDVDDTRRQPYGEYYSSSYPLTQERMMPVT